MFVKAIRVARNAMFPIFRKMQIPPSQIQVTVMGTGFFINSKGYFVSVAHLFDSANAQTSFEYRGKLPEMVHNPAQAIKEVVRDDAHDIFVGKVEIKTPVYFYIEKKQAEIGKSACISGYPLAEISFDQQSVLQCGAVRRYFQPSFILDNVTINCDNGSGKIRTHVGFLVRDFCLFGMSGGPVFDTAGKVIGIQGSVTQPRESIGGGGRKIIVENAVAIRSGLILELLKKHRIKYNFRGKF